VQAGQVTGAGDDMVLELSGETGSFERLRSIVLP
jgi:hypothetical protein